MIDENRIFDIERKRAEKIFINNVELCNSNINLLAITILNIIHRLTNIEMNIERIFKLYNDSEKYNNNQSKTKEILQKLSDGEFIHSNERNSLLNNIAIELKIKTFDEEVFRNLANERNKIGHIYLKLDFDKYGIPIINAYSRKEGLVETEKVYKDFMKLYNIAQDELEPIFLHFGIKSIYWKVN